MLDNLQYRPVLLEKQLTFNDICDVDVAMSMISNPLNIYGTLSERVGVKPGVATLKKIYAFYSV